MWDLVPWPGIKPGPLQRQPGALGSGFFPPLPLGVSSSPQDHIAYHPSQASPSFFLPGSLLSLHSFSLKLPAPILSLCFPCSYINSLRGRRRRGHLLASFWCNKSWWLQLKFSFIWKDKLLLKEDTVKKRNSSAAFGLCLPFLKGQVSKDFIQHALHVKRTLSTHSKKIKYLSFFLFCLYSSLINYSP